MTIICLHITGDLMLLSQAFESKFELDFIPEHHGWLVIIVFGSVHVLFSHVAFKFLFGLNDWFRINDLSTFCITGLSKFLDIYKLITLFLYCIDFHSLPFQAFISKFLEIIDMVLINFKTMCKRCPFDSLNKLFSFAHGLFLIGNDTHIYINIVNSKS